MMASAQLQVKLRAVVEELWSEHRTTKTEEGLELPDPNSDVMDDAGCGCQTCILAGQMLYEAGG